jgi:serine/threonine protein phosphatase 1
MSRWIISDCHGCYNTLTALLEKLPPEANSTNIVFVGDMVDRGPDSRKVIDFIRKSGYDCVIGNHEELMIDAFDEYKEFGFPLINNQAWIQNGGLTALNNYIKDDEIDYEVFEEDVEFLRELPNVLLYKDELDENNRMLSVTHAVCIDFIENYFALISELEHKDINSLSIEEEHQINNMSQLIIWNRRIPTQGSKVFFNVSGHNIIDYFIYDKDGELKIPKELLKEDIIIDKDKGYSCIDSGAFLKTVKESSGKLTCLEFPTMKIYQQNNIEELI